ncbi:MAG: exonuclease SbcCD subunit D [Actinomycetota bacterium]|nr:exonuclease SbcCD subunit D [Actinomycetota bacterium]
MKILHTADWHVGKKLGRFDRDAETRTVLRELVDVAAERKVDLVIVAGDLFDRGVPPLLSMSVVLQALVDLAATGAKVVAIPGNHDSAGLFEVLAPHLAHSGITFAHKTLRPEAGGVVEIDSRDGKEVARVACFPFLHQAHIVEFLESHEDRHKSYAERIRAINRHYAEYLSARPQDNAVDVLVGHFMIHNAVPAGSERPLHIGEAYMATEDAVPHQFNYVALGHIHKAQAAPGSEDYARYAGSVMQLDFGEADQEKSVVVADVSPDGKRHIEQIPIASGRRLVKVTGTIEELKAKVPQLEGAILSVEVLTDAPSPNLSEEVHAFLPDALYVRVNNPHRVQFTARREGRSIRELYAEYHAERYGVAPPDVVTAAFEELVEEVGAHL